MSNTSLSILSFLGDIYFDKERRICGFIIGEKTPEELEKKKTAIFSTGINNYICTKLLEKHSILPSIYCENYKPIQKKNLRGIEISDPYSSFRNGDIHYIIAVDFKNISAVRAQMKANDINEYSVFFQYNYYEYPNDLNDIIIKSINTILSNNIDMQSVFPSTASGYDVNQGLGIARFLLDSTSWWHWLLLWLNEDLEKRKNVIDILEIGPGYGLLSTILKNIRNNFNLDWLSFGTAPVLDINFDKLTHVFPGYSYNNIFGIVEDPKFAIEKKYDIIVMTEVFEHFHSNPVNVMTKIADSLNTGGMIYLSTPNWAPLYIYESYKDLKDFDEQTYQDYSFGHNYHYNKNELIEIFTSSGLRVIDYKESVSKNHNFVLSR